MFIFSSRRSFVCCRYTVVMAPINRFSFNGLFYEILKIPVYNNTINSKFQMLVEVQSTTSQPTIQDLLKLLIKYLKIFN